jgi:hypothetical protein
MNKSFVFFVGILFFAAHMAVAQDDTPFAPALPSQIISPDLLEEEGTQEVYTTVIMQGLDKTTARVKKFDVPINGTVKFGSLEITARNCKKNPPEETPESAAFLIVDEVRPNENKKMLFSGWMFASSPALSALEHPVYDVWVLDCKKDSTSPMEKSPQ